MGNPSGRRKDPLDTLGPSASLAVGGGRRDGERGSSLPIGMIGRKGGSSIGRPSQRRGMGTAAALTTVALARDLVGSHREARECAGGRSWEPLSIAVDPVPSAG